MSVCISITDLPLYATAVLLGLFGRFLDGKLTIFLGHATPEIQKIDLLLSYSKDVYAFN